MNKPDIKILDFYVHGGHQYEFMKIGYNFDLCGLDHKKPDWATSNRPPLPNVRMISQSEALLNRYDIVIVRSPVQMRIYEPFIKKGAIPVAVVQTTEPYPSLAKVKVIVWNCYETMKNYQNIYEKKYNFHIVHGFDPDEFKKDNAEKNNRVLTVANAFKKRNLIMGYDIWCKVNNEIGRCDIIGDSNKDIGSHVQGVKGLSELVKIYNRYSIFLNTTQQSAMPRSRSEAAMCGMPVVSTNNFGISKYFTDKKDMMLCRSVPDLINSTKYLLNNKNFREEMGLSARETAIKHFHIKDYIQKWKEVIGML